MMERLVCVAIGYLFGLFQTAYIYGKLHGIDIRNYGSGNAGTTNTLRVLGTKAGLIVLAGDILKCILAIAAVRLLFAGGVHEDMYYLLAMYAALGAILGHDYPFYLGFKGGKGVLVGAVMLAFFDWRVFVIAFALFILSVVLTKWISLGSILGAVSFPITTWLFYRDPVLTAMAFGMAAAVIFMHRSNIGRILHGTENKFSFKSKKTIEASPDGEEK